MKCAIAAVLVASAFALLLLSKRGFDPGTLVVAGDQFTDAKRVPLPVERHSAGYDGQFYYRLALNPFTHQWTERGIRMDVPTYRQQRIFMPLVVWVLSFGRTRAVASLFLLLNVASLGLLAWSSARLVEETGANAWWSAAVWMYPGWIITMTRDCVEILEVALLVTTFYLVRRQRRAIATAIATCAVLTKETAMLAIAAMAVAAPALLIAIAAQFGLKFTLFRIWHAAPSLGTGHFSVPFAGMVRSFRLARPYPILQDLEIAALVAIAVVVAVSWRRAPLLLVLAFALYIPLIAILDQGFWVEDWSFMRATSEYWVLGGLIGAMARSRMAVGLSIAMACTVGAHVLLIRFG